MKINNNNNNNKKKEEEDNLAYSNGFRLQKAHIKTIQKNYITGYPSKKANL
jgi:hypothetical protein